MRPSPPALALLMTLGSATAASAIIKGVPAPESARHAVMILGDRGSTCTGAVLTQNIILTAAHCVTGSTAYRVHFRTPDNTPVLIEPASIHIHPEYDADAIKKRVKSIDLAIVTLAERLPDQFSPIAHDPEWQPVPGNPVTVLGYGLASETDRKSLGTYRSIDLAIVEPYGKSSILLWLSAPQSTNGKSGGGACHGDSGGLIVAEGKLVATTTWTTGTGKAECGALTQGALLGPQSDWIAKYMKR